ncbi:MAG: hypothetical protein QXP52_03445 [Candidatus Aenigmatarchaeota archaeon]
MLIPKIILLIANTIILIITFSILIFLRDVILPPATVNIVFSPIYHSTATYQIYLLLNSDDVKEKLKTCDSSIYNYIKSKTSKPFYAKIDGCVLRENINLEVFKNSTLMRMIVENKDLSVLIKT